jgi:eukaryotic-like serine/threonine-protein kinase
VGLTSPIHQGALIAGKYRVTRILGEGGMGVVVAAVHEQLDQPVALKFLLPDLVSSSEIVQRFTREARAAVKIHSEHVARVLDVGTTETGTPFMVMEYLEGGDLAEVLASRGPLPVQEAVGYLLEACEAIAEAHSLGVVHRDLKPANLFLARKPSGKPVVKVLDFGISKAPSTSRDAVVTSAKAMMGSPGYMSPEQMVDGSTAVARSDIWSLGVVLYELLSGTLPFTGDTMPELVAAILSKIPAPVAVARGDVPAGMQGVIDRCLQKDPAARYADIGELARALVPFGPARGELSVERIEHVLGQADEGVRPTMGGPHSGLRYDNRTFSPTTSQSSSPGSRVLVPGLVVAAVAAAGVALAVLRPWTRPPAPPAVSPTAITSSALPTLAFPSAAAETTSAITAASASSVPATTPTTSATTVAPAAPTWAWGGKPGMIPRPSAAASTPAAAPTCHVASYFDADGNKHFKQVCP